MKKTGTKKKYAIIGDPVSHSLSPAMHNAAFQTMGISAEYEAIRVPSKEIDEFMASARKSLAGFNVTVPNKAAVLHCLDWVDDFAARAKSVNTVLNNDGTLIGFSTDGYGLEKAIEESFGTDIIGKKFLFIGAGGAARAAAFHLLEQKAAGIIVANRTLAKAESLAAELAEIFSDAEIHAIPLAESALLEQNAENADILVQSTSLGLRPDDPSPVPKKILRPDMPVFDMVYAETRLLKDAAEIGAPNADGAGMLLHQGAKSFAIWTGIEPPLQAMRNAIGHCMKI